LVVRAIYQSTNSYLKVEHSNKRSMGFI
jgi:hypothetical protein